MHLFEFVVLAHAQVEPDDGIFRPLRLHAVDGQTFEELSLAFKICLQRRDEQRLAEAARAAQEKMLACGMSQLIHILRLVHIHGAPLYHVAEHLKSYSVSSFLSHAIVLFFFYACKNKHKKRTNQKVSPFFVKSAISLSPQSHSCRWYAAPGSRSVLRQRWDGHQQHSARHSSCA